MPLDNLTIAIVAAVVGSVATFLLTQSSASTKLLSRTRPAQWIRQTFRHLIDRYRIRRTRKTLRDWFSHGKVIRHLEITKYETAIRTRGPSGQQPQLFHGMGLKKPRLAPKLNDYHIAATMEDLCKKGILVKLPEPQIGSGYFYYAGQPADPKTFSISFFGGKPSEARKREATAEEERRCIECHHWRIVKRCPGNRYSFLPTEKVEGNRTWYGTKTVKNDDCGSCERCWEDPEKL